MIHDAQIVEHGGLPGIRDEGLLESSIEHPLSLFSYSNPTLFELAAAYAERIIKNHPLIDGNKRTAYVVMLLFLKVNNYELIAPKEERAMKCIQLASGEIDQKNFAAWLENNTQFCK